jgi:hypothetical protein
MITKFKYEIKLTFIFILSVGYKNEEIDKKYENTVLERETIIRLLVHISIK